MRDFWERLIEFAVCLLAVVGGLAYWRADRGSYPPELGAVLALVGAAWMVWLVVRAVQGRRGGDGT